MTPENNEESKRSDNGIGTRKATRTVTAYATDKMPLQDPPVVPSVFGALSGAGIWTTLFIVAVILPTYTSFMLGSFRLTAYRLFLIFSLLPCVPSVLAGRHVRRLPSDLLILVFGVLIILTLTYHHGFSNGLESGGILVIESFGSYCLARVLIRDRRAFQGFAAVLIAVVLCMLVITVPESLTGNNLVGQPSLPISPRYGLHRARGTFDHPIINGIFCASITAIGWYSFSPEAQGITLSRIFRMILAAIASLTSVSSGAMIALWSQWIPMTWDRLTRNIPRRWRFFAFLLLTAYVGVDLLSTRTPMKVFLTYLTFSASTAYGRLIIWEWGFHQNVVKHPLVGIGLAEWIRPSWLTSGSIDNFWLCIMIRHGLPCFFFLALGILYMLVYGPRRAAAQGVSCLYKGWAFSLIGMIVAGCTVHFWNAAFVYFFFFLGAGAWFHNQGESHT